RPGTTAVAADRAEAAAGFCAGDQHRGRRLSDRPRTRGAHQWLRRVSVERATTPGCTRGSRRLVTAIRRVTVPVPSVQGSSTAPTVPTPGLPNRQMISSGLFAAV